MTPSGPEENLLPLTPATFHILVSLADGTMHGYAIKRAVEERTAGIVRLGAGTLYVAIQRIERQGLIQETDPPAPSDAGSKRWRFYRLTDYGQQVLEAEVARLESDVKQARSKLALAKQGRS